MLLSPTSDSRYNHTLLHSICCKNNKYRENKVLFYFGMMNICVYMGCIGKKISKLDENVDIFNKFQSYKNYKCLNEDNIKNGPSK